MNEPLKLQFPRSHAIWLIYPPTDPWGDGYVAEIGVEVHDRGLDACGVATLSFPPVGGEWDLAHFIQGLAEDWRGWPGERSWRSMGGELLVVARHDGKSHVTLGVTLRQGASWEDGWMARVVLEVEAGEQLSDLAGELRAHLTRSTAK